MSCHYRILSVYSVTLSPRMFHTLVLQWNAVEKTWTLPSGMGKSILQILYCFSFDILMEHVFEVSLHVHELLFMMRISHSSSLKGYVRSFALIMHVKAFLFSPCTVYWCHATHPLSPIIPAQCHGRPFPLTTSDCLMLHRSCPSSAELTYYS